MKKQAMVIVAGLLIFMVDLSFAQMTEEERAQNCKEIFEMLEDIDLKENDSATQILKDLGAEDEEIFAAAASFVESMLFFKNKKNKKRFPLLTITQLDKDELESLDSVLYNLKYVGMLLITKEKLEDMCQAGNCTKKKNPVLYQDYASIEYIYNKIIKEYFKHLSAHEVRVIEAIIARHKDQNQPNRKPPAPKNTKAKRIKV